jgi:hypothetical protein
MGSFLVAKTEKGASTMNLDELIISMFVTLDDELNAYLRSVPSARLRQRGPAHALSDSEVLTMECVGEMLGLDCDNRIFGYFSRHFRHSFPTLAQTCRTSFVRQAANLWHPLTALSLVTATTAPQNSRGWKAMDYAS